MHNTFGVCHLINTWDTEAVSLQLTLSHPFRQQSLKSQHANRFRRVCLFSTPWTVAHQAPLSMGFSRQEYWSGLPCPPPGDLPNPGIKTSSPVTPALQVDSLQLSHRGSPYPLFSSVAQSCLPLCSPMDGGAWWTLVHGVAKSRTQLSDFTFTFNAVEGLSWWLRW